MRVQKRNGDYENVSFDKILNRISSLCNEPGLKILNIDPTIIAQKICSEIHDKVSTTKLDILSSEVAISLYSKNLDFKELASRIVISNHHKNTSGNFSDIIYKLYNYISEDGTKKSLINENLYNLTMKNKDIINDKIDYKKDYKLDYFGFKTLEKSYLLKINNKIVERPQDLLMRVSLSIHRNNLDKAFETYEYMSNQHFIHATPTLFNAGTNREQFSSCFLLMMQDDSVEGIYDTLKDCALISQSAGGIGLAIHNIRGKGSFIAGTNGISNGIVPMLRNFNDTARYIDQGGGKRNGSFAIYLEPWHSDIFEFLELKKNHGNELERARDLFYGLWINDLFMERVKNNEKWSLFCPNKCKGLYDKWGKDFEELYLKYEKENKYNKRVNAQELWFAILNSQIETGTPYLVYKDTANRKSNQQNLGTIKSSNLCTEIIEYTNKDETAVCNLASISLKSCLDYPDYSKIEFKIYSKPGCMYCNAAEKLLKYHNILYNKVSYDSLLLNGEKPIGVKFPQIYLKSNVNYIHIGGYTELEKYIRPKFNHNKLVNISKILTTNLNNIIDYNYYPTSKTKLSNFRHRPIGIGIQGLANVFYELKISFDSDEAKNLNKDIFESIYYGALIRSMELAKEREIDMKHLKNLYKNKSDNLEEINKWISKLNPIEEELNREKYLGTYSSYIGSPMYNGKLQFDLWGKKVDDSLHNWTDLRKEINKYGIRNSLLLAPMPTASTSQILGNYECFEPVMANIYSRRVLSGEYLVMNDYMIKDLDMFNMWTQEMKDNLIKNDGSIQAINGIPDTIKQRYKTAWELKQKNIIDMSSDRGQFICQSQSLNLFMEAPNYSRLSSMHFYAHKQGLKTGMYYLRTRPSSKAIQFTIAPETCEMCSG